MAKKQTKKPEPTLQKEESGLETYEKAAKGTSRWFVVTASRFDWLFAPNKMKSFKKGQVCYEPLACISAGLSIKAIDLIEKPDNAHVDKSGRVIFDGN